METSSRSTGLLAEEEFDRRIGRCLSNTLLKCCGGISLGIVTTLVMMKWRTWPLWLGGGIGLGIGYSDCDYDFRKGTIIRGRLIKNNPTEGHNVIVVDESVNKVK